MVFNLIVGRAVQEFSLGGQADSTYEYFIKGHVLLGGSKAQYKDLYVKSVEAAKKYLFFTPLVQGDPDVLLSGKYVTSYTDEGRAGGGQLKGEMQHLVFALSQYCIDYRLVSLVVCLR